MIKCLFTSYVYENKDRCLNHQFDLIIKILKIVEIDTISNLIC